MSFLKKYKLKNKERDNDTLDIKLSDEQEKVFNILENTNDNIYVTGKAGTGKSLLLKYFVKHTKKRAVVVAPTGVAALNVGGQTIHSMFRFPPSIQDPEDYREQKVYGKLREILHNIDVIIIDEISMVSVDLMESINVRCQAVRGNKLPFGGLQLICFGDLYQLPPVITDRELHRYLNDTYGGIFFFNAPVFKESNLEIYELNDIYRQRDESFKKTLNKIRLGINSFDIIDPINECYGKVCPENTIILASRNDKVSFINRSRLAKLTTKEYCYIADIDGDMEKSIFPTDKELYLKPGAQVMMLVNDKNKRWMNGTIGTITKLSEESIKVKINGVEHAIDRYTWDKDKYYYDHETKTLEKEIVSSFTQFPVRLAWAITIHKSQGQTYESVLIDLTDGAFDTGQAYVALSRCVSLDNLYLKQKIKPDDIKVNTQIVEFMENAKKVE